MEYEQSTRTNRMQKRELQTFQTTSVVVTGFRYGMEINEMTQIFKRNIINVMNPNEFRNVENYNVEQPAEEYKGINVPVQQTNIDINNMDVDEQISDKTPPDVTFQSEDQTSNDVQIISVKAGLDNQQIFPTREQNVLTKVKTYSRQTNIGCRDLSNYNRLSILKAIFTSWWRITTRRRFTRSALNIPLSKNSKDENELNN